MKKYRTSEIIFGTREKLLELRNKLLQLEELTVPHNRRDAKEVLYEIIPNHRRREKDGDQIFICKLYDNRSLPQNIKDFLRSGYLYYPTILTGDSELEKDDNGDYKFEDPEFNQSVSIIDQNRFKEIIEEIQESDVYNEMAFKKISEAGKGSLNYVKVSQGGIYISNTLKNPIHGQLYYNPAYDLIAANAVSSFSLRRVNPQDVQELLNVEVDGSLLTDYQRFLIDSSEASKKKIIIDDCHEKTPYFGIEEGKDSIHLVKKKRKSLYL